MASIAVLALALEGCASITMGAHQPNVDNISALRDSGISKLAVGEFTVAKSVPSSATKAISVRGNSLHPASGDFGGYLKEALATDLRSADKLDPSATRVVSGEITENKLNPSSSRGTATLAARFRVSEGQQSIFDKELRVESDWESSFVGAIAIPAAVNNYTGQYALLLNKLYRDEDFRKACRMPEAGGTR